MLSPFNKEHLNILVYADIISNQKDILLITDEDDVKCFYDIILDHFSDCVNSDYNYGVVYDNNYNVYNVINLHNSNELVGYYALYPIPTKFNNL